MNRDKFTDVVGIKFVLELAIVSKKNQTFAKVFRLEIKNDSFNSKQRPNLQN